ncbi:O-antigen polymerase [Carnobacterium sp.]|uniref:O-antigen polymerase n=1 Tax=Carnobacterium sp. TaxID=48221 RepID=UPI00388D709C
MLLNKKNVFSSYIFIFVMLFLIISMFKETTISNLSGIVMFTFILNGFVIFIRLLKSSKLGYSLSNIIDMFMFAFMFLAPIIQYVNKTFPWDNASLITDRAVVITNFIILIFLAIYYFFYDQFTAKYKKSTKKITLVNFINVRLMLDIGFIISLIAGSYIFFVTGFTNLFARSTNSLGLDGTTSLVVNNFLKGFPMTTLLMNIVYWQNNKKFYNKFQALVLLIITVLLNFPTGNPRFQVAVIYLGLLIAVKQKFNNKYFFKYLLFIGLFIIFPLLNIFRNNTFSDLAALNVTVSKPVDDFLTGNYDSYSMLTRSIIYGSISGTTLGGQLLGSILFFVPRSIWPNKPIGSGAFIAKSLGWDFTNVSMPYIGEGYINFGLLGVILFSIVLAFITSTLDYKHERIIEERLYEKVSFISVVYPIMIGFIFFIMRGDLLSSLSFTIGSGILPIITLLAIDKLCSLK